MPTYDTSKYSKDMVFTFATDDGNYVVHASKLDLPLSFIYLAFESDLEIQDTFHKLQVIVDDYILNYKKQHNEPLAGMNMLALSGVVRQMMVIQQVLAACAMIFNAMEFVPEKEEK